jgi:hypothetical protein
MNNITKNIENELIQIRPNWYPKSLKQDVNIWSRIHPRFIDNDGCIVDLGCLGWNKEFEDKTSDNWAGYFFNKKRVIGVDPQENPNPYAELFKGFISNFSGKAKLSCFGYKASMIPDPTGEYKVLTWKDFKVKFNINKISILKINIEGAEWDLIDSFQDFDEIDQICISFHNFLPEFDNQKYKQKTQDCINKIINNDYIMIDLKIYGWKLFLKITNLLDKK